MSQSPANASDSISEYGKSWTEIIKLVRSGTSWSGRERNCVYLNVGGDESKSLSRFANISSVSGFDFSDDARAIAITDWDLDGDLDIWVRNRTAPRVRLLRNDCSNPAHSVVVRLRGTLCHADAIGAVAQFKTSTARPVTQSVHAGDAFISQSSSWLHFGTEKDAIGEIEVLWPGGKKERFAGIQSGKRYELVQGTGKTAELADPQDAPKLADATQQPLPSTAVARIVLQARLSFPPLVSASPNSELGEEKGTIRIDPAKATLLTVWTSTCPNCLSELNSYVESADRIKSHGLQIIGINIDNLQGGGTSSVDLQSFEPNLCHQTTEESLTALTYLQQALFDKYPPFVVPWSFLLDSEGNIGLMYRGTVKLEDVFNDMSLLTASSADLRNLASPFAGSWFTKPVTQSEFIEYVAKRLYSQDQALGVHYFEHAIRTEPDQTRRQHLRSQLVTTHRKLARDAATVGDFDSAVSHYRRAIELGNRQEQITANYELGLMFASNSDFTNAETHLLETLRLQPQHSNARQNLEKVRQQMNSRQ
ncbi:MAG: ASPIC/UnbV domain-containing protein [Planctomycetales bacterium]|nr:ASPIC/UnbV domain-containing protein [Planctomycetales bacterium]